MDIGKSFTYMFDDEKWIPKLGIALLMVVASFLLVPILLVMGWMVATTRNVKDGLANPLAEWDDWGQLLRDGGIITLASLIYSAPFIILFIIGFFATIGFGGLSGVSEDLAVVGIFATYGVLMCLGALMALALFFIGPAIVLQYIRTNDFAACFQFGEIINILRENTTDIIIVALVPFGISLVASVLAAIPCLGWIIAFLATPYQYAVLGHLYGQLANKMWGKELDFEVMPSE